jgi:DNA-binding NarL/FixJ family response regulator
MDETRKRIVLADDDTLLREGIASLLQGAGFDVVGQARDAPEVLTLIREQRPDLAIMDIRMPPGYATEGLDAAQQIRQDFPAVSILVLSAHAEVEQATELLAAGQGVGYLLKSRVVDVADFAETVGRIAAGGSVVDPALVQELVSARRRDDTIQQLTSRERDVLALLAEGRSNAGIAHQLWITEGTVEKHVRSILARLRLPETEDDHRRVLAVLAYLESLNLSADDRALRLMENAEHGCRREIFLGQERDRRGVGDHVLEVRCGVGGDENDASLILAALFDQQLSDIKAGRLAQLNV